MSLLQENITALVARSTQLIDLANSPAEVLRHIDFAKLLQERYHLLADFERQAANAQREAAVKAAHRDWADRAIRTLRNDLTHLCEIHQVTLIEQDCELGITVTDGKWAKQLARFAFPLNYNTYSTARSWRSTAHPGHYVELTMDAKTRRYARNETTGTMRWEKIVTAIRTMLETRAAVNAATQRKKVQAATQLERVMDDVAEVLPNVIVATERTRDPWDKRVREYDVIKGSADGLSVDFHGGPNEAGLYSLTIHASHIDGHRLAALLRMFTEKGVAHEQEA